MMKGKLRGPNEGWNNPLPHSLLTIIFETTTTTTRGGRNTDFGMPFLALFVFVFIVVIVFPSPERALTVL